MRRMGLVAGACVGAIAAALLTLAHAPLVWLLALSTSAAIATALVVRLGFLVYPVIRAGGRAQAIEAEFPDVAILCYALAKGGLHALEILRTVRDEKETYGEISDEFGVVVRDVEWFGEDLNTALENAAATTPSARLRSFFSGLVAILNSGADPRDYFRRQAEAQLESMDTRVEKELEQSGLLAESYVSGLLVLPLLLMIVISVMSVFTGGKTMILRSIVFLFIPIGTLAYAVLVDTMLPSAPLAAPPRREPITADFGMEVVVSPPQGTRRMGDPGEDLERERAPTRPGPRAWARAVLLGLRRAWRRAVVRAERRPVDAFVISFPLAGLVGALGGLILWRSGASGEPLRVAISALVVGCGLLAIIPVAIFHEIRARHVRLIEKALPETIGKLSGFNDRGISILQAFKIVGQTVDGPLAKELQAFDRDVKWNFNFGAALRRLRKRISTPRVTRLSLLLERASASTSDLKEVLDVAAQEATRSEAARARKRQGMMSYVVVVYVVFAVFLYILYMITNLLYGADGFAAAAAVSAGPTPGVSKGIDPEMARMLFFQAVLIQGACCGIVAGRLGEGYVLSGLKHVCVLVIAAWITFAVGVF